MYFDRNAIQEYPHNAVFTRTVEKEGASYLEPQEETITVLETVCDVMEAGHAQNGSFVSADYALYFPFNKEERISVRAGDIASVDMYGIEVKGKVLGVFPSQLEGVKVYIEDLDV